MGLNQRYRDEAGKEETLTSLRWEGRRPAGSSVGCKRPRAGVSGSSSFTASAWSTGQEVVKTGESGGGCRGKVQNLETGRKLTRGT